MKAVIEKIKKAKILTPLKIGLLVTLLNTLLLLLHYRNPGSIYDVIEPIEQKLYDIRYRIRGHIPHSGQVGILAADDKSIEKFGRWPFPRNIYPKIFENLQQAGVEWVGFDVFFSEPSRRYLDESSHELKLLFKDSSGKSYEAAKAKIDDLLKTSPGDIALQQGIDKFKNVVQGFFFIDNPNNIFNSSYDYQTSFSLLKNSALEFIDLPKDMSLKDYEDAASLGVVTNTKFIAGKALHMGFANNMPDTDGLVRKYRLVEIINPIDQNRNYFSEPILVPSLGLSLAANYLKSGIVAHFDTHGLNELELVPEDSSQKSTKIPLYAQSASAMLINHYGSFSDLPQISLADAYDNKFPKQMPKILIYGGTGTGTNDKRPNPFDKHFDGVGFHATAVENILNHNFMSRSLFAPVLELSILVSTGIIISLILKYASAAKSGISILIFSVSLYFIDAYFLFGKGKWMYIGIFYIQAFSIFMLVTLYKYFSEERDKKMIRGAFQHYLNPAVISTLIENPSLLKLGGEKKTLTVFFSDVRGFTTISESLSPEKLTSVLNEYFTPMTKVVLDSNGLLDKYIGDAIMAVWGAPITLLDHADRALDASLEMLEILKILQAKWKADGLPHLDIGIGINTGEMVVGNMGSDQRFDYTVLGDSVNLGSRLEGITKNYGIRLICSQFTKESVLNPDKYIFRELDFIRVKGKNEPIKIYEVMEQNPETKNLMKSVAKEFEEGLAFYKKGDWDNAFAKFQKVLELRPEDGPAKVFVSRCEYLKTAELDHPWDGIWTYKTK